MPTPVLDDGVLYLAPPHSQTLRTIERLLTCLPVRFERPTDGIVSIGLFDGALVQMARSLSEHLSDAELADTKTVILAEGRTPSFRDLMQARPLSTLVAQANGAWLIDLLREERLTTWFQPIVDASNGADVVAHECLSRGFDTDGVLINPGRMFDIARQADLLFHLDRVARLTAIAQSVAHGTSLPAFINFNPTSIYNPNSCLQSTRQAIDAAGIPADRIVFEVVESEEVGDADHLLNILNFYRDAGFRVALDDIGSGYSSLNLLAQLKPDYMKLDMQLVRGVDTDRYKSGIAARLLDFARSEGIMTVAEGIETRGEWEWVRDHGADYAQGYFFARPSAVPVMSLDR